MLKQQRKKFSNACINGEIDVIDSMLDNGFDVNHFYNGMTPLQVASTKINPWGIDVVTKLLTHGANVDMKACIGWTALSNCLFTHPFQPHVSQLLLDCSKLGVNRLDSRGRNYFHYTNTIAACKFLIDNGTEVNNVDNDGYTNLDIEPNPEICSYLISVGAKKASDL